VDPEFWRDKWAANQIGFHEDVFHPMLCQNWDKLSVAQGASVLVPLCGKSRDLVWLRDRGYEILAVELSEIATQAFFDENDIRVERDIHGPFIRYRGGGYTLLIGNIFDLTSELLGAVAAFYDRAALIALPPDVRRNYVRHMQTLINIDAPGLLITVSYPEDVISPPPFVVSSAEVRELYSPWCDVSLLNTGPAEVKGVAGSESVYQLKVRP